MATDSIVDKDAGAVATSQEKQVLESSRFEHGTKNLTIAGTFFLALNSLGVIYGDIGTSPLYVFNAIFPSSGPAPSTEDTIGALSAIIWAISIIPLIKYAWIALQFGNSTGEGGPFAVYTSIYPPPEESDEQRALTNYTTGTALTKKSSFLDIPAVKSLVYAWVLFATCLTISDGLLTPAVSVVSAVEGIAVPFPNVQNSVVGISCAILVLLFLVQFLGTRKVGFLFAPVVFIWLALIGISGAINIRLHPGVFRAFDPSRAVMLFVRTKKFDLLSGVLLAITGVEAMFANLGQYSKGSIRLAFTGYVYPCLILAYLGQGAQIIEYGDSVMGNVFFNTVPGGVDGGFWWVTWVFAILAAIIASQAMITATFSLTQQLIRLHAMPAFRVIFTTDDNEGNVFAPMINILLLIGTIGVTVGFGTDAGLTNAYGFAVSGVLIITTTMLALALVRLKHFPVIVAIAFLVISGFFDGLFWGSSLKKVPHGAWFPLGLAVILCIMFEFWSWAKSLEDQFDATHRHRLQEFLSNNNTTLADPIEIGKTTGSEVSGSSPPLGLGLGPRARTISTISPQLPSQSMGVTLKPNMLHLVKSSAELVRLPIFGLFHNTSAGTLNGAPHSFSAFLNCYPSLPQIVVFFNVRVVGVPHTHEDERWVVSRVRSFDGIYIATLRLGYRDPVDLSNVAAPLRERLVALEARAGPVEAAKKAAIIDAAIANSVTHILPHFHVSSKLTGGSKFLRYIRSFLIEDVYRRVAVNFDEYDGYRFGNEQDVLRIGVNAAL
ncbi:potassium transporter [Meredithblackwellia eburnea MCA 4105]